MERIFSYLYFPEGKPPQRYYVDSGFEEVQKLLVTGWEVKHLSTCSQAVSVTNAYVPELCHGAVVVTVVLECVI